MSTANIVDSIKIFLSTVTSEFEPYRLAVKDRLVGPLIEVKEQADFLNLGRDTLAMVDKYIETCSGVVHLIGDATGDPPAPINVRDLLARYSDLKVKLPFLAGLLDDGARFSFTQWEAYLALYHGKLLFLFQADAAAPRGPKYQPDTAQKAAQIEHRQRLESIDRFGKPFDSVATLCSMVLQEFLNHALGHHVRHEVKPPPKIRPRDVSRMPKFYSVASQPTSSSDEEKSGVFGRLDEQEIIDKAWASTDTRVLGFIAGGGVGKSTLVMDWLARFDPAEPVSVFAFSFYLQGQTGRQVDTDTFLDAVATYFEIDYDKQAAPFAKGQAIAREILKERFLIVLDGVEPLQEAATGRFRSAQSGELDHQGTFTDNGARGFIETIATDTGKCKGLCILTSRIAFADLKYLRKSHRYEEHPLEGLKENEGAAFLKHLGVWNASDEQRRAVSREMNGHPLALLLHGTMIRDRHGGSIVSGTGSSDITPTLGGVLHQDDEGTRHTFKMLQSYEEWYQEDRLLLELELLHVLGLFDREAEPEAIEAVRAKPKIAGLTEHSSGAARESIGGAWTRLANAGLISRKLEGQPGGIADLIDAHPLIRRYFGERLKHRMKGKAFRAGHKRLCEHYLSEISEEFPRTRQQMALLYRTISHCCLSGQMKAAFVDLLEKRAWRLQRDPNERHYATRQLGMISADFVALCQFFEGDDVENIKVHPKITGRARFSLLTDIAVRMRSLGRIRGAKNMLRKALENISDGKIKKGYDGAFAASQLSELELISGELKQAEVTAKQAVAYADLQPRTYLKFHARTSLADVLLQKGDNDSASRLFEEARRIAKADPNVDPPFLYSQTCYRFGLFLIETGHANKLIRIAGVLKNWGRKRPWRVKPDGSILKGSLLSSAIDQMILAEALVRHAPADPRIGTVVDDALAQLTESGYSDYLARGLNVAARHHTSAGNFAAAATCLEQNREHVTRGGMRLLEADYLIEQCRNHLAKSEFEAAFQFLGQANDLCAEIGYGRRSQELEMLRDTIARSGRVPAAKPADPRPS